MASYEDYLKELGHTADSVVMEKISLENEIKSLSEKIRNSNHRLPTDMKSF